jgi:hypothetical protein
MQGGKDSGGKDSDTVMLIYHTKGLTLFPLLHPEPGGTFILVTKCTNSVSNTFKPNIQTAIQVP